MVNKTLKIALTGGIGSGKTIVSDLFVALGAPIIDTDELAKELTQKNKKAYEEILKHFGQNILMPNEEINRKKLREIIFNHTNERTWLERCLHPKIITLMDERTQKNKADYVIIVIPLLFETKLEKYFDRVLAIDTSPKLQIERVKNRDHISEAEVKLILKSQISRKERIEKANDIIENNADINALKTQVSYFDHLYRKLAQSEKNPKA